MTEEKIYELHLPYPGKGERLVRVFVPEHREGETLPVIYMTDGQNLFDEETSTFVCWHTREAVRASLESGAGAAIIVGIHADPDPFGRTDELTPKCIGTICCPPELPDELIINLQPKGEIFDDFLVNTVMPAVEARFPVQKGRSATAVCGSSSGGLQAYYTAVAHPDIFCAAGVLSPAFLVYKPGDIQRWTAEMLRPGMPFLYIYSGAGDKQEEIICRFTEEVCGFLTECYPPGGFCEVILPENIHHESAWEPIFTDFLHTFLTRKEEL